MSVTTQNKKLLCAVSICSFADIIISHDTKTAQSDCAVSGMKTVLKNVMPFLRDDKDAEAKIAVAFKGLEGLKNTAESSVTAPFVTTIAKYLNTESNKAFIVALPAVLKGLITKLSNDDPLLKRFATLSRTLGTHDNIAGIPEQLSFLTECLAVTPPPFIGDDECKALTMELTQICDLDYDTLEETVYAVFRKIRESKIEDTNYVPTGEVFVEDPVFVAKRERSAFVKGLQKYTLETLLLTKEFLDSHNLRFYLTEGTLLGAIRHNGFIPWDDDIDIVMPREDYDKLVKLANENKIPPELNFDSLENNPKHWVLGAKMQLTRQTPYIQHKVTKLSACNGPYVDIFPLDYWNKPASIKAWKIGLKMRIARRLIFIKTGYSKAIKKKPERILARLLLVLVRHGSLQKSAIKTLKNQYNGNRKYMVNLCSYYPYYKEIFPTNFFGEPVYVDFEGHKMPVPCEYDYILKTVYGKNYDTIPPVRVTNMRKHAFDLKEDITE